MHSTARQSNDKHRWAAIVTRDAVTSESFFYGVKTTGIYCRPGCKSRRPRRENVEFFESAESAERSGYRACQRCRPAQAAHTPHLDMVLDACRRIEMAEEKLSLEALAARAGMSKFHFQRVFKSIVGVSPKEYATAHRFGQFRQQLLSSPSVTDAMHKSGFSSSSRAYESAGQRFGMAPSAIRQGGGGLSIAYAITETDLGSMLVAATDRGICMIAFGDDQEELIRDLTQTFPRAQISRNPRQLTAHVEAVVKLIKQPSQSLDLPLDIQGTAFQQRVWQALRQIPAGETITYSQLAKKIGRPKSTRAVASACARNKLAVAIPCHRVINSTGGLSGYRWGIQRKKQLLQRERQ
jgi:AraC family transcriptional regulator, regulatory protein of adaptative response / methylated-DNA-[protein]-cysteine methyltransferase